MVTINLRGFYPWCKEDIFMEIMEEMLEAMKAAERQGSAYKRRTYRYKRHYTLDMGDSIENECIIKPETPEEICIREEATRELFAAIGQLTKIQQRRLIAYYFQGMNFRQIAEIEGVNHAACWKWDCGSKTVSSRSKPARRWRSPAEGVRVEHIRQGSI